MSKRQGISESQVLAGVVAALSFCVTYLEWPVEAALLTFVASLLIHAFAWVRRWYQKKSDKHTADSNDYMLDENRATIESLRGNIRERDRIMKQAGINYQSGDGING